MIDGLGTHGYAKEALRMFLDDALEMIRGMEFEANGFI
jgi:hypothetical protein